MGMMPATSSWRSYPVACASLYVSGLVLLVLAGRSGWGVWWEEGEPPLTERTLQDDLPWSGAARVRQQQEHLARLGVARWHAAGYRGQGIRVAVLDAGFRGYRAALGRVLPARVQARSFRRDGDLEGRTSQHGVLCAEVIHVLAPAAELLLANWDPDRPESFLQALAWARQQQAHILSCSLIMPSWSDGEGGGPVHAALQRLLGSGTQPGDMLFFASAGNTAKRHWCGPFQPEAQGWHQWRPGCIRNHLFPWGEERLAVEVYGPAQAALQVFVYDAQNQELVGHSTVTPLLPGSAAGSAVVRFLPQPRHTYYLQVRAVQALPVAPRFHLTVLGANLEQTTPLGSVACPADGARVLAVGAVDAQGRRLEYSSCGPNSPHPKPDLVAEVPFPSRWRERPFTGTSAAAPQAAGLAAVLWSRYPHWSAHQVQAALRAAARDLGPPGHDWETGYGRIALP